MKNKLYKCKFEGCEIEQPILSKGLCPYHRQKQREEQGNLPKPKYSIKPISEKAKLKKKETKGCLEEYFDFHIQNILKKPFSEESGKFISDPTRANVCHVVDKGRHKSIQCCVENAVYLTFEEHSRMDKLLFEHRFNDFKNEFPNTFPLYVQRYNKLRKLMVENTKFIHAFDLFLSDNNF